MGSTRVYYMLYVMVLVVVCIFAGVVEGSNGISDEMRSEARDAGALASTNHTQLTLNF